MTIILEFGTWHVEYHRLTVDLPDAASGTLGALQNLDRPGAFIGIAITGASGTNNDNTQAVALYEIVNQSNNAFIFGDRPTGIRMFVIKQIGTSGVTTITFHCLMFIRDARAT